MTDLSCGPLEAAESSFLDSFPWFFWDMFSHASFHNHGKYGTSRWQLGMDLRSRDGPLIISLRVIGH